VSISVFISEKTADKRSTGRRRRVSPPVLLCFYLTAAGCLISLCGCGRAPDILSQEPVIPLTGSPDDMAAAETGDGNTEFPKLHLTGEAGTGDKASDTDGREAASGVNEGRTDAGYRVEGVQLSEKQLEKISAYFNLKEVNPYLQQVYLIPEDFDPDAENEQVNITCVAGSYDSNRLYSIFYKKEGSSALWNVIMRRNDGNDTDNDPAADGTYRFHSNQLLDPTREEGE
jgi:hypothetical protein